ncbi:uncharacterized protein LOC113293289 isoform X2 [Papaver somniferum]|uniref:uncharacterized protein LOC113293289 isoform X2 n=1 Tax=Papaver somniferum TaxID=3469 RepID=UPI000E70414E|nr:uncharacterized protein LOC113293289 isoform X2 [Papaver somniferum]
MAANMVDVCVDTEEKQNEKDTSDGKTTTDDEISASPSVNPAEFELGISIHEYPTVGLSFDLLLNNSCRDHQNMGGFIVSKCYAAMYTKICKIYGHIATTEVWKNDPQTLVIAVAGLLPVIEEMEKNNLRDVSNKELYRWDDMISNCEVLRLNVGWIRHRLEIIKIDKAVTAANIVSSTNAIIEE